MTFAHVNKSFVFVGFLGTILNEFPVVMKRIFE